jgi:Fe(3+) dicitrate transport protein
VWGGVYGRLGYSYIPVAEFQGARFSAIRGFETVSVSGNRLPYAPEHIATAMLGYSYNGRVDTFVELVALSRQFTDDLNSIDGSADGQRGLIAGNGTWNAGLNVRLPAGLTAYGVVYNAADRTYIADRTRGLVPGPPRRAIVGFKAQF